MIIMVGDKDGQIDQPHGRPQPRMERCPLKDFGIRREKKLYEVTAKIAKLREEIVQSTRIVIGLVSTTVRQVGYLQLGFTRKDLRCPTPPKRFDVDEVADVFLR